MKITKDTTDAQLWEPVLRAHARLEQRLGSDDNSAESLAATVNEIARAEGEAEINHLLRNALAYDASAESIERTILQAALRSADDTYSGRQNDCRRAKREGLVSRAKDLTQFDGIRKYLEGLA